MKPTGRQLSLELREDRGNFLRHRRVTAACALISMASLGSIALYQLGVFRRLPEPPLPGLDAEKVHGSAEAYRIFGTPDAVLGLGSYAATLGLAAMNGTNRAETHPWIPLALAAKASLDALQAAALTCKSWSRFKCFSLYSLVAALATWAALPAVMPEARVAWLRFMGGRQ
jgi:hypothetical protein